MDPSILQGPMDWPCILLSVLVLALFGWVIWKHGD
jgi:hypothetical protein